jgi:hypothetical protein
VHFSGCTVAASAALFVYWSSFVKEPPKMFFAVDDECVSGDGHRFRCCTVGELLRDSDWVSVIAVREKCDEKV